MSLRSLLSGCTLIAAFHTLANLTAGDLMLSESDNGKVVTAEVGQSLLVDLRANPSTGFAWSLIDIDGSSVVSSGSMEYTEDPGEGTGAGGICRFPFQAVQPGDTTLSLEYRQPWNPQNPAQTFSVTVAVQPVAAGPFLKVRLQNGQAVVTWPQAGSDAYYLEGAADLSSPQWNALNVLVRQVGTEYEADFPLSGTGLFFRLRK